VWKGIAQYATEHNVSACLYVPKNQSVGSFLETIGMAAGNGARLVVAAGVLFETPVWLAQHKYEDICFILIDGVPHNDDYTDDSILGNAAAIQFDAVEAGFLAGYAAVAAGYSSIGFIGAMPVPEIAGAGFGFVQGAGYAANEMARDENSIEIRYAYAGTFMAKPEIQALAAEWYDAGAELIFAAGGEMEFRVALAAASAGRRAILYENVNANAIIDSRTPPIAAVVKKDYASALYDCLTLFYSGAFPGGALRTYGVSGGRVSLDFRYPEGGEPIIARSEYYRIAAAISLGTVDILRFSQNPYIPPSIKTLSTPAINIIEE
jgi:basic membrane protein A